MRLLRPLAVALALCLALPAAADHIDPYEVMQEAVKAYEKSERYADARAALRGILPDYALPHRVSTIERIPERGPGKPDRRAIRAHFAVGD